MTGKSQQETGRKIGKTAKPLIIVGLLLVCAGRSQATTYCQWPGFVPMPCDSTGSGSVYTESALPKPAYRLSFKDNLYHTTYTRVSGDSAATNDLVSAGPVVWGKDTRHHYSKDQPWCRDQSLFWIENRPTPGVAVGPAKVVIRTEGYLPQYGLCSSAGLWDFRWDPRPDHQKELVNITKNGDTLSMIRATQKEGSGTCAQRSRLAAYWMPQHAQGFGDGEGNLSWNGRWLALWKGRQVWVVDRDSISSGKRWPYLTLTDSLYGGDTLDISNVSISPLGGYVNVHYSQRHKSSGAYRDGQRILDHNRTTHVLSIHKYGPNIAGCSAFAGMSDRGWVYPMKHADMTTDSLGVQEYLVGGRSCDGEPTARGHVVAWRLSDGQLTFLTRGSDPRKTNVEASVMHVSCRNILRPGWAYVTYDNADMRLKYADEVVAVRVEGANRGAIQRFGQIHDWHPGEGKAIPYSIRYRAEPQAVPSWDGRMVMVASNWARNCGSGCGSVSNPQAYVIDARSPDRVGGR